MNTPERVFVALGANLGDPEATVQQAFAALDGLRATRLVARSSLFRTAPVGVPAGHPDYINAVAELATGLTPLELLDALLGLELRHGRERPCHNAPRTLDLDLLVYGERRVAHPRLDLPHPRMHERAFVLAPLAEIAPELLVPGRGQVAELLEQITGQHVECL